MYFHINLGMFSDLLFTGHLGLHHFEGSFKIVRGCHSPDPVSVYHFFVAHSVHPATSLIIVLGGNTERSKCYSTIRSAPSFTPIWYIAEVEMCLPCWIVKLSVELPCCGQCLTSVHCLSVD